MGSFWLRGDFQHWGVSRGQKYLPLRPSRPWCFFLLTQGSLQLHIPSSAFLKPAIQSFEGIWALLQISSQGRWEKWGFGSQKGSRFTGQVKIPVLGWTPQSSDLSWRWSSQICCRGSSWIQLPTVFSKCGAHITPQLLGKEEKKNNFMCITSVYFSRVSSGFWTLLVFSKGTSVTPLPAGEICGFIPLIQLPLGPQWEQDWILMKQTGLKSSFPF